MTFRVSPILCERPETAGIKCSTILRDSAILRLETTDTILCERLETAGINCSTILRDLRQLEHYTV